MLGWGVLLGMIDVRQELATLFRWSRARKIHRQLPPFAVPWDCKLWGWKVVCRAQPSPGPLTSRAQSAYAVIVPGLWGEAADIPRQCWRALWPPQEILAQGPVPVTRLHLWLRRLGEEMVKSQPVRVTTLGCLLRPDAVRVHAVLDDTHLVAIDEAGVVAGSVPLSCQRSVRLWQGRLEHPYTRRQMAALPYCWSRPCASWKPSDKMTMRSAWTTKSSIARRQCIIHDGHQEGASTFKLSCFSLPGPQSVDGSWHAKSPQSGRSPRSKIVCKAPTWSPSRSLWTRWWPMAWCPWWWGWQNRAQQRPLWTTIRSWCMQERNSGTAIVAVYEYVCF